MIRKIDSFRTEIRDNMRGGDGSVKIEHFWEPGKEMLSSNRMAAKLTLAPGSSIGFHNHDKEDEIFIIVKGTAEVDDNGEVSILNAGDTLLTGNGAGHAVRNIGKCDLEIIAIISTY
ncbi:MAG: cupin domain-containing protein [Lentisphaeria bacterium]|nr:cupin domain-containing protein [Lentisphaeria bacterium]